MQLSSALRGGGCARGDHHVGQERLLGEWLPRSVFRFGVDALHGHRRIGHWDCHLEEGMHDTRIYVHIPSLRVCVNKYAVNPLGP